MANSVWGSFGANVPTRDVFATETFAALRLLTPPFSSLNVSIELDGGTTKGDGFGGIFYYDPNSVLADDNLNVIAPSTGVGRWRRVLVNFGIPAAVIGGILFGAAGNTIIQDSANLFWDNTNKRLGIGNAAPTATLDVTGSIKSTGYITGGNSPLNPGGLGANRWVIDNQVGQTRFFTYGTNGATNGSFVINSQRSDGTNSLDILTLSGTGVLTIPGSVVTPLVGTDTAVNLALKYNGTTQFNINNVGLFPATDNTLLVGSASSRVAQFTGPILDSGTTGSLSLRTNNGQTQIRIDDRNSVNFLKVHGNISGGAPSIRVDGTDANISLVLSAKGTNGIDIYSNDTTALQCQVLHTASANQNPTITGGNGVNSRIGTSAGGLDLTSATIRFTGIGTTAVAANATLNAVGSNDLLRSTSSQRYKKDWRNLEDADLEILNTIRTIKYKSISEQDDPSLIHYGMLAEDVFKLNKNLVTFDTIDIGFDLDVPDWVQYERFIPLLIEQRRRDVKRIEALEAKLNIH